MRVLTNSMLTSLAIWPAAALAVCANFTGSTMDVGGGPKAAWRTDYPASAGSVTSPWQGIDFKTEPEKYMKAVLDTAKPHFKREGKKLVGTGTEPWWISLWMDYTQYGREPLMGLTKERGPDPGDLSATNGDGYQVWAVGFYNTAGASVFADVFSNPCDVQLPQSVNFPASSAESVGAFRLG